MQAKSATPISLCFTVEPVRNNLNQRTKGNSAVIYNETLHLTVTTCPCMIANKFLLYTERHENVLKGIQSKFGLPIIIILQAMSNRCRQPSASFYKNSVLRPHIVEIKSFQRKENGSKTRLKYPFTEVCRRFYENAHLP